MDGRFHYIGYVGRKEAIFCRPIVVWFKAADDVHCVNPGRSNSSPVDGGFDFAYEDFKYDFTRVIKF